MRACFTLHSDQRRLDPGAQTLFYFRKHGHWEGRYIPTGTRALPAIAAQQSMREGGITSRVDRKDAARLYFSPDYRASEFAKATRNRRDLLFAAHPHLPQ
jgi:hypothetical protein